MTNKLNNERSLRRKSFDKTRNRLRKLLPVFVAAFFAWIIWLGTPEMYEWEEIRPLFPSVDLTAMRPVEDAIPIPTQPTTAPITEAMVYVPQTFAPMPVNVGHFQTLRLTTYRCPFDIERTLWHDGYLTIAGDMYDTPVELRGRGNSTWHDGWEKRPLRLRFETPTYLLGIEYAARDWILLANHLDRSLMRNYAVLMLAAQMGQTGRIDFLPTSLFVHLYVNGEYMGVYQLTDERDAHPSRIDISRNASPARSEYLLELNARAADDGVYGMDFFIAGERFYDVRFPRGNHRSEAHVYYARHFITQTDNAIRSHDWEEIIHWIDVDSFVDFYLMQELFKNPDVASLSVFLSIRGYNENRHVHMGPVWDFDTAAGNTLHHDHGNDPQYLLAALRNDWYRNLMQIPAFQQAVAQRWHDIRHTAIPYMLDYLDQTAHHFQADFERNFNRHPIMGVDSWGTPTDILAIPDFMGQVEFLISWLQIRTNWMDDFFHNPDIATYIASAVEYFEANNRERQFMFNGNPFITQHAPHSANGRIMLATDDFIRLGFGVDITTNHNEFDEYTREVVLTHGNQTLGFMVGDTSAKLNDEHEIEKDTPSMIIGNHIYIPLRMVELFGMTIDRRSGRELAIYDAVTSP